MQSTSDTSKTLSFYPDTMSVQNINNPNQYAQYPPRSEAEHLPAYNASMGIGYNTSQAMPYTDANAQYPPVPPAYYGPYAPNYGGGYYPNNNNYNQGWNQQYYGSSNWNQQAWTTNWMGQGPPPQCPTGAWVPGGGWGSNMPLPGYDPSGIPLPSQSAGFSDLPRFSAANSSSSQNGRSETKQPLLGPGGLLTHLVPPPIQSIANTSELGRKLRFYVFNKERELTETIEVRVHAIRGKNVIRCFYCNVFVITNSTF